MRDIHEELKKTVLEIIDGVQVIYKPFAEDVRLWYKFGREFTQRTKEYHKTFE